MHCLGQILGSNVLNGLKSHGLKHGKTDSTVALTIIIFKTLSHHCISTFYRPGIVLSVLFKTSHPIRSISMLQVRNWRLSCSQGLSRSLLSRARDCPDCRPSGCERGGWPGGAELPKPQPKQERQRARLLSPAGADLCICGFSEGWKSLLTGIFSSQ